jgi:hypothetical protein
MYVCIYVYMYVYMHVSCAKQWAKIPECHYAATAADAAAAGFDDQFIYDAIRGIEASESSEEATKFVHSPHSGAVDVFKANYSLY